ncbi:MAG: DUF1223 domain-containing protein [Cyclobacteriaceae bacterium]|nr:DUF1223 domain-containing protein [Cyclobacteriaceae bacterium]
MKHLLVLLIILSSQKILAQGFAVVELFTSQGCSSCPSADKNLSQIIQQSQKEGKSVYGLSFHVDYWNYIGWKDPYSSKEFTKRQQVYAHQLGLTSTYTPQMIVNGRSEFVGSSRSSAETIIDEALLQKSLYTITISNLTVSGNTIRLNYVLDKSPSGEVLNLALVEKDVTNYVSRGENKGKELHHDNVVRAFKSIPMQKQGTVELQFTDINIKKSSLIAFSQDQELRIVAATAQEL